MLGLTLSHDQDAVFKTVVMAAFAFVLSILGIVQINANQIANGSATGGLLVSMVATYLIAVVSKKQKDTAPTPTTNTP